MTEPLQICFKHNFTNETKNSWKYRDPSYKFTMQPQVAAIEYDWLMLQESKDFRKSIKNSAKLIYCFYYRKLAPVRSGCWRKMHWKARLWNRSDWRSLEPLIFDHTIMSQTNWALLLLPMHPTYRSTQPNLLD